MIFTILIVFFFLLIYVLFFSYLLSPIKIVGHEHHFLPKSVSIIVVGRNEEKNIQLLLSSLILQNYPSHLLEILFFDDHSDDQTFSIVKAALDKMPFRTLCYLGEQFSFEGKKRASLFLASKASHELLLFTDADVEVPSEWVSSMVKFFSSNRVRMVCGAVAFQEPKSFMDKLYVLEFAALIQSSIMSIQHAFPIMCNAANMMVGREDYLKYALRAGGDLSSGDDVFLLKSISEVYGAKSIVANGEAIVMTPAPHSLREFVHQRIRWAGKSSKSFFANSLFVGIVVFGLSLSMLFLLAVSILSWNFTLYVFVFFVKWIFDFMVLRRYSARHELFGGWVGVSFFLSLLYPFYVVCIAMLSLKRSYLWKGRVVE